MRKALKNHLITRKQNNSLNNEAILLGFKNLNSLTKDLKEKSEKDSMKIAIVEQSIASGWSGFFEVKNKDVKQKENLPEKKEHQKFDYEDANQGNLDFMYDN